MKEVEIQLENFEEAIKRLKEALEYDVEEIDIALDAVIKRFEFTFELAWKSTKLVAKMLGNDCYSPRESLKLAYKMGWIRSEEEWLRLLEARNLTSHTYNRDTALDVYETIKANYGVFDDLLKQLKSEISPEVDHV